MAAAHEISPCITINDKQYLFQDVPGDGNCFFHCLSLAVEGDLEHSTLFRNIICGQIVEEWDAWQQKVQLSHGQDVTLAAYSDGMFNKNWWAASVEIEVAAKLFDRSICVWLGCSNQNGLERFIKTTYSQNGYAQPIELLLVNSHFLLLKDLGANESDAFNPIINVSSSQTVHGPSGTSMHQESFNMTANQGSKHLPTSDNSEMQNPTLSQFQQGAYPDVDFFAIPLPQCNEHEPQAKKQKKCSSNGNLHDVKYNDDLLNVTRKLGVWFDHPVDGETKHQEDLRKKRIRRCISSREKKYGVSASDLPDPPPCTNDKFDAAMDAIRAFELEQLSYKFDKCTVCNERKLDIVVNSDSVCKRCSQDKNTVKMFSDENLMNPLPVPEQLQNLSLIEQQLIARISPCMSIHMLKHGGIGASGHCVTFPQEINEPAKILPRLPEEIQIVKIRKKGKNDTSKDFRIRRKSVEIALHWLKSNNPVYKDITISQSRLNILPEDDDVSDLPTVELDEEYVDSSKDKGPADEQINVEGIDNCTSSSGILFPDKSFDVKAKVDNVVHDILGNAGDNVVQDKRGTFILPWPSRGNVPLSEFTTQHFFSLAFPCLFPFGTGDYHINRPRTCNSLADWAEHLMWYKDGRFARHKYFKFVAHNMIMRHSAINKSTFIVQQKLGDPHLSASDLKNHLEKGDSSIARKILYFTDTLRGTSQYWARRCKELRALVQFKIHKGEGLPSYFTTGSCAEFHFKPLRRLLSMYVHETMGKDIDLTTNADLYEALQDNTHVVAKYFDLRTQSYFSNVMTPVFGVNCYWYRQEFAKSRGMVHWHGLCWRADRQPHNLLHQAVEDGLSEAECADAVAEWAKYELGLTANHPAGSDEDGNPKRDKWPPPEGTAPAPTEENNPLVKLLMDVSESQDTLLEDHLLLCNKFNLHRCSDYCLRPNKHKKSQKECRMEFGTETEPGKPLRQTPEIVRDRNNSLRLEMPRDHPTLVQHSRFHTQGWRANGDMSLILSKSDPENPSVNEIIATERYITGYACKGNQSSDSLVSLFHGIVDSACEKNDITAKSVCSKFLMNTVKRDISAVEASHELSRFPLYRCSHQFQSISLSGFRVLDKDSSIITKGTALDQYLTRNKGNTSSFYNFICDKGKVPVFSFPCQPSWPLEDKYSMYMMLLYWPNWRNCNDIKPESVSWVQALQLFLTSDMCPNFLKAEVERVKQEALKKSSDADSDSDSNSDIFASNQPEWMSVMKPTVDYEVADETFDDGGPDLDWSCTTSNYPLDSVKQFMDNLCNAVGPEKFVLPDVDLCQMNDEQLFCFNIVLDTLQQYNTVHTSDKNFKPLRLIVSGTAGSGKSFLIKCIVKAVRQMYNEQKSVQVICPTGSSANIIDGVTLHSLLKVPTYTRGQEMSAPEGFIAECLQRSLQGVKVLLLDERSLVGATTLGWMEFMCSHGVNKGQDADLSWGGLPVVVFFGDDIQLPPVSDFPLYKCSNAKSPAALHGTLVWQEFQDVVHLSTIVRQNRGENQLRDTLMAIRNYTVTPQHVKWLQNFQWQNSKNLYGEGFIEDVENRGLFVFSANQEVRDHNTEKLQSLNKTVPVAKVLSENKGYHATAATEDKCSGLSKVLYLSRHSKVMLTANLAVKYGLYNGAIGIVTDIVYKNGRRPPDHFPDVVLVEFSAYTGPSFIINTPKVVPIVPVERNIDCACHKCKRKQLPLRLGWATTIHKCQGMTIGEGEPNRYVVIHPGTKQFESRSPGALFVALSRAKSSGTDESPPDFVWHSSYLVNEDRFCYVVQTPTTEARTKEINRLNNLFSETKQRYKDLLKNKDILNYFLHEV